MTREEVKAILPILQAFAEGKAIQSRCIKGDTSLWYDDDDFSFDDDLEYRIKPSPTYRPFKDAEECWNEMKKHQPFGWVKDKDSNDMRLIIKINSNGLVLDTSKTVRVLDTMYANYTFADGSVFGVKEE